MFERFTGEARRAIFFANFEARKTGRMTVEVPHLLLGLIREDKDMFKKILGKDFDLQRLAKTIEEGIEEGVSQEFSEKERPLSLESEQVLEKAGDIANSFAQRDIPMEYLLLAILEQKDCPSVDFLAEHGFSLKTVRDYVDDRLS